MEDLVIRSNAFAKHLDGLFATLSPISWDPTYRIKLSVTSTNVSLDHAAAVRLTLGAGHELSAIGLIRLQYEALLRACWLLFLANEEQLDQLTSPLSPTSQMAANKLPGVAKILPALAASPAPENLKWIMASFHEAHGHALNSFVHGGIHSLHRAAAGFPPVLAIGALKQCNILVHTAYRLLAHMAGAAEVMRSVTDTAQEFPDCLSFEVSATNG